MSARALRLSFAVLAAACVVVHVVAQAHAQSSLGIGTNEAILPQTGLFAGFLNWVNVQQQGFYRALTGALKGMRDDGGKLWLLVGLSFAYGVFHAAGPGHGKAVISSYMLANEVALRRGIMLSFVSAFLQAASAIVLIGLVFLFLRGTAVSMTDATWYLEVASYALVTAFGAWLLWQKAGPRVSALLWGSPARSLSAGAVFGEVRRRNDRASAGHALGDHSRCAHDQAGRIPGRPMLRGRHALTSEAAPVGDASPPAFGEICESCGHSHAPDPALLASDRFDWRTAWTAVAAVGLRPCSGALIVLTFAFLNGLWFGGVLSVLAMAVGTAITVSILATLAVTAKNWAVSFAGDGRMGNRVHAWIEIGGAALVFGLGLMLLSASLAA